MPQNAMPASSSAAPTTVATRPRRAGLRRRRRHAPLLIIVILQAAYAAVFIVRSSFVIGDERYYCLFDDAMISMRYAANWAAGAGLVWNPGEAPVEGYTNFGWTILMGVAHFLPLAKAQVCLVMQVIGAEIWIGCTAATFRLAGACRLSRSAAIVAAIATVWQWNLIFFSMNGMETGLLTLLITLGLTDVVRGLRAGQGSVRPYLWFALAALVRPDVVLIVGLATAALLAMARRPVRTILGAGLVGGVLLGHALWRHSYYAEWLPCTYYLKATGWPLAARIITGLQTGFWTVIALLVPLVLAIVAALRWRTWALILPAAFAAMLAYCLYVGGDAWPKHYRFVLPVTPGLFVGAAWGLEWVLRRIARPGVRPGARVAAVALVLLSVNALHLPNWVQFRRPYGSEANRTSVLYALAADRIADPQASAAVVWAGAFPYYAERRCFDMLGKCDPYIARLPVHEDVGRAGHNKFDSAYTLSTYRPDIVVDRQRDLPEWFYLEYQPVLVTIDATPIVLAVRKYSPHIHAAGHVIDWDTARPIFLSTSRL